MKLHAICVTAKIVKIIIAPNSSKSPGFNCVVVLKSFESELPDILADFFNMSLKESSILCENVERKSHS